MGNENVERIIANVEEDIKRVRDVTGVDISSQLPRVLSGSILISHRGELAIELYYINNLDLIEARLSASSGQFVNLYGIRECAGILSCVLNDQAGISQVQDYANQLRER